MHCPLPVCACVLLAYTWSASGTRPSHPPHPHGNTTRCRQPSRPALAELVDLRLKFEADKGRISELRASRNFKPF